MTVSHLTVYLSCESFINKFINGNRSLFGKLKLYQNINVFSIFYHVSQMYMELGGRRRLKL